MIIKHLESPSSQKYRSNKEAVWLMLPAGDPPTSIASEANNDYYYCNYYYYYYYSCYCYYYYYDYCYCVLLLLLLLTW